VIGKITWKDWKKETILAHTGFPGEDKSSATPIFLAVAPNAGSAQELAAYFQDPIRAGRQGYIYGRLGSRELFELECALAGVYGAGDALAFASGMAAISGVIRTLVAPGDNIVANRTLYGCTYTLLNNQLPLDAIDVRFVDMRNPDEVMSKVDENTRMLYCENPANPNLNLISISALSKIAADRFPVVIDATFAGPFGQDTFKAGADIVVHSLTKIIAGHGISIGGVAIGAGQFIDHLFHWRKDDGAVLASQAASSILTGARTLAVRYERMQENAGHLIEMLLQRKDVLEKVHYPSLDPLYPQLVANEYMTGAGYMITVEFKGGFGAALKFINSSLIAENGVSLGDFVTKASHPASTTQALVPPEDQLKMGITPGMVRISVGGEHIDDIKRDIEQALDAVKNGQIRQAQ
jgi:methionine-gamma-lyase